MFNFNIARLFEGISKAEPFIKEELDQWKLCDNCGIPFRKEICPICGNEEKPIEEKEVKVEEKREPEKPREERTFSTLFEHIGELFNRGKD